MSDTGKLDYSQLDPGIRKIVAILIENDIETFESCEGTKGHCYLEPTVRFNGKYEAGLRALALCYTYGVRVSQLRRAWNILDGEPVGPHWELTFLRDQPDLMDFTKEKNRQQWLPKNWGGSR